MQTALVPTRFVRAVALECIILHCIFGASKSLVVTTEASWLDGSVLTYSAKLLYGLSDFDG